MRHLKRSFALLVLLFGAWLPSFAALSASTNWQVWSTGATTNGGGFDLNATPNLSNFTATSATSAAPVVSGAGYNFQAADVGRGLVEKAGTNWNNGTFPIVSVAANAATVDASIGHWTTLSGALGTVQGIATVASPTGGSLSIDYSMGATAIASPTDISAASTAVQITSALTPFNPMMVGDLIQITTGTHANAGTYEIATYIDTNNVTLDRTPTTGGAMAGATGNIGGAQKSPGSCMAAGFIASNKMWVKATATYSISGTSTNVDGGPITLTGLTGTAALQTSIIGYTTYMGDGGQATMQWSASPGSATNAITGNSTGAGSVVIANMIADGNSTGANTRGINVGLVGNYCLNSVCKGNTNNNFSSGSCFNCFADGGTIGWTSNFQCYRCYARNQTTAAFSQGSNSGFAIYCLATANNQNGSQVGYQASSAGVQFYISHCGAAGWGGAAGYYANAGQLIIDQSWGWDNVTADVNCNSLWCQITNFGGQNAALSNTTLAWVSGYVQMTTNPFTAYTRSSSGSANNFTPNATAGGGAVLRSFANQNPNAPNTSVFSYDDWGPIRHQDPSSSGGGHVIGGSLDDLWLLMPLAIAGGRIRRRLIEKARVNGAGFGA